MSDFENEYEILLKNILILTQKQLGHINEIYNITKEMSDSFSRNDTTSAKMLLKMRGNEIIELDKVKRKISNMLFSCNFQKTRIESLLKGKEAADMSQTEKRICLISKSILDTGKKTVEADRIFNTRIAGDKSFYKTNG